VDDAAARLEAAVWHALLSLLAIVPILAVEALPDGAAALLLVTIWVVGGVVPARVAMGGFASSSFMLAISVFAVGAAVAASGLLYRFSLWAVARAGGFVGQIATLGVSGLILGAAVPNATGRMSLVASGITELSEAVGYPAGSRAAAGLALAAMAGFGQMAAPFVTSSLDGAGGAGAAARVGASGAQLGGVGGARAPHARTAAGRHAGGDCVALRAGGKLSSHGPRGPRTAAAPAGPADAE